MDEELLGSGANKSKISLLFTRISQVHQATLDKWTPHRRVRWASTVALLLIFALRVFLFQWYQGLLDKTVPWQKVRWLGAFLLICGFMLRIFLAQGWYIVTYALGIYHLNLLIAFLTPKVDPGMMEFEDENGPELPTRANEEFRPFIRRLPEFKCWYSVTKSTVVALILTLFECTNIPVFWPILVLYFLTLTFVTMRRQCQHMIKYKYLPFTHGKPKYQTAETGKSSK